MNVKKFRKIILDYYQASGRKFPWREKTSPWGVMLSEFMLQQTQTERVIPYWERWMKLWPTPQALAASSMQDVLREWSGLGYNNRCRYLKDSAEIITKQYGGKIPREPKELITLPGVGSYVSGAIACFAYNYPAVFIETNIRAAALYFFFSGRNDVNDNEIFPILESALDRENPRLWNYALMDYGAALKKLVTNPNRRSAHYTKQSPFEGSFRQARGKALRVLIDTGEGSAEQIGAASGLEVEELYRVLDALKKESMVAEEGGIYRIKD